jgi:hypothetical protein
MKSEADRIAGECRKCGASLDEDSIGELLWTKPYCPDCWPDRCPHCGVKEWYWSLPNEEPRCDSGCYMNGAELTL